MNRRRVLITGGGGFVGSALASGFVERGWHVTAMDSAFAADPESRHDGVQRITAEIGQTPSPEVPAVDVVVHAAWVTTGPESLGISDEAYQVLNLDPLRDTLHRTVESGTPAFVFLSSSGVFSPDDGKGGGHGITTGDRLATDAGLTDDLEPTGASPYARAKRAGEVMTATMTERTGTAAHVVRLGYVFGPGEVARPSRAGVSLVAGWVEAAQAGRPLEVRSDDPLRDWTFAPDLAAALERLVARPAAGRPVHLGSPCVVRDAALAEAVASGFPGAEVQAVPPHRPVKAPMVPSDLPELRDVDWTSPAAGVRAILESEVAS